MTVSPPKGIAEVRPVLPWRWVAGGLMHFAVVAYLLLVPLLCLMLAPAHASTETIARLALRFSLWFLGGLALVAMVVLPIAAVFDRLVQRRRRRRATDPLSPAGAQSRRRVEEAVSAPLGEAADPLLARITAARWDHTDPRHQALARDLHDVVTAAVAALASAAPERRAIVLATTVEALTRIADELDALAAARAQADEMQVQALSNYLSTRYPALDSPLRPD